MPELKMKKEVSMLRHDPYTKSSVFADRAPRKRFQRQLSHSRIGLVSPNPAYAIIRPPTPTRERKGKESLEEAMAKENVTQMWRYYMDLDPSSKPLSNRDLLQVGKRLTATLIRNLKKALASEDEEQLRKAVEDADGRLHILKFGGLNVLKEAKEKLGMNPDELPQVSAILGPAPTPKVRTPIPIGFQTRTPSPRSPKQKQVQKKKSLDTTADTIATATSEDGEGIFDEAEEAEEAEDVEGEEGEEAEEAEEEEAADEEAADEEEGAADEEAADEEEAAEEGAEEEAAEGDAWEDEESY